MKSLDEIISTLNAHREELEKAFQVRTIAIFGSYARGEQTRNSDNDIIVSFEETPTFIEFIRLEERLTEILGIKVDLLTEESISPYIRPYIEPVKVL